MVEPTYQCRFIGKGIKPPKGALVKSQGIERYGKRIQHYQVNRK